MLSVRRTRRFYRSSESVDPRQREREGEEEGEGATFLKDVMNIVKGIQRPCADWVVRQ